MAVRRFEFVDGSSNKFWQIDVVGNTCQIRYGKIGTDGQSQTKVGATPEAAQKEADKLIKEKTGKGYKEVVAVQGSPTNNDGADLEAAIYDNPADDTVWQVYADYLTQQGNPLGEYCALAIQGKTNIEAKKAADKLLEKNGKKWLGKLFEQEYVTMSFHNGFLSDVRLAMEYEGEPNVETLARAALKLEIAKFMHTLRIGVQNDDGEGDFTASGRAIISAGVRRGLRALVLGDFDSEECEVSWTTLPDIAPLATILPDLETLEVKGAQFEMSASSWPKLKSFTITTGGLGSLKGITEARWPNLERLEIWFGQSYYGCEVTTDQITQLLARTDMPRLTHLGLVNHEYQDTLIPLLIVSPMLRQVTSLDLSKATLGDESGEQILANISYFRHLKKLDLSENYLTPAMVERLEKELGMSVGGQRTYYRGDERRYCVLGE